MLTINFKSVSILSQSTKYSASLVGGQTTTYTTVYDMGDVHEHRLSLSHFDRFLMPETWRFTIIAAFFLAGAMTGIYEEVMGIRYPDRISKLSFWSLTVVALWLAYMWSGRIAIVLRRKMRQQTRRDRECSRKQRLRCVTTSNWSKFTSRLR